VTGSGGSAVNGAAAGGSARDRYRVQLQRGDGGWAVHVMESAGPDLGAVVFTRACAGEAEARTFASTVNQHLHWLSEAKFREYYRLDAGASQEG
jgi:hypothetical protein